VVWNRLESDGSGWGMGTLGLLVATLGVILIVVAAAQFVTGFLGNALSWSLLLGVFGVIFLGLGSLLALTALRDHA
jgi:hypothetical protein